MTLPFFSTRGIAALVACVSLLLSACASISGLGGSAEYGCKAPQGMQCDSVSGNYYNAIRNDLPSQRQRRQTDAAGSTAAADPRLAAARLPAIGQTGTGNASPGMLAALPLRSQARVLRLWFKPWEDADYDLYDQGFVYVQIDNGRWLIDHAQRRIRDAYAPIRPPHPAASVSVSQPATAPAKPADPGFFGAGPPENTPGPLAAPSKPLPGASDLPADDGQ
ncbi:MAG: TraV family lipoprotein [Sulfuriferula sp.]